MPDLSSLNRAELAAFVQTQLRKVGIDLVLSGGSCVSIYSEDQYVSADLDFVVIGILRGQVLRDAMAEIGFIEKAGSFWHDDAEYFVEFPPGPLAVGSETVGRIEELNLKTGLLRMLSPTDCVKDRLAAFYHWNDLQSLEHAVLVASMHKVDIKNLKKWSMREGKLADFGKFLDRVAAQDR
jgi:hypothetical protein